jgi:hypothetical protein
MTWVDPNACQGDRLVAEGEPVGGRGLGKRTDVANTGADGHVGGECDRVRINEPGTGVMLDDGARLFTSAAALWALARYASIGSMIRQHTWRTRKRVLNRWHSRLSNILESAQRTTSMLQLPGEVLGVRPGGASSGG